MEYALTRVQSQYGSRLAAGDWRRLEASHDLGQYLESARNSALAPWVFPLDRHRDAHVIERSLRSAWRRYVNVVAAWHPRCWQPWLAWLEWLPSLALLAQLARTEPAPAWLLADSVIGPAAAGTAVERLAALEGTTLAGFEPAIAGRLPLAELWVARWRELQPPADPLTEQLLAAVCRAVQEHARRLEAESADADMLRDQLRERLKGLFRAAAGTVVATLCHLTLMALDFERLRGGLVTRAVFATDK